MLSVRRRQEDARGVGLRGGAAAGGMDDDAELEEGEACGDETAFVDPDVALSYIDEKIQDVLGHFQKDFEGAVSAENLGSKFGGYGSFLPTYQRSPLPQTRSPPKAANVSSRSPYHQPTESMSQNTLAVAAPSVSKHNGSMVPLSDDSSKKEVHQSTKVERASSTHDSLNGPSKSSDHNRFKVRIKVGSDNGLARNNAAIYSGLGLDISSPSSVEDSPDCCGSLSPEFNNVPIESPRTILQIMTCFSVPGGFLLSPLRDDLVQLTQKVVPTAKKWETNANTENVQERYEGYAAKRVKSDAKKKKAVDTKRSKSRNDVSAVMKNEIDIETPAGQKIVLEALNIPLLSNPRTMEAKDGSQFEEDPMRDTLVENKDARLKERTINSDLMAIKSENVKAEAAECLENSGPGSSGMDFSAVKGEVKFKAEKAEIHVEDRNTTSEKDFQLDRKQERKIKTESKCNATGVNFEGNKVMNERTPVVGRSIGKVSSKETLLNDINEENVSKSESRRSQKEQNMNASSTSDFLEDDRGVLSSGAVKERKNDPQSKSSHPGRKPKAKSHRDVREHLPEGSYGGKDHDTFENGSGLGELRPKKIWKNDSERDSDMPGTSKREISSSLKNDRHTPAEEQRMHVPPSVSAPTANAAPMLPAPVVIEEHWVCCDICQKWRLLPYEMNPSLLPKKWKCSMLQWLPGMNRCEVSEDETTNALNALYVIPAPGNGVASVGHSHVASSGLTTSNTLNVNGHVEQSRKRKNTLSDGNVSFDVSQQIQASVYPLSNRHAPIRSKSAADSIQFPVERDSKSVDHFVEKKRSKSKNHGSSSDGGHLVERSKKHSKVKSKREMDHDEYRTSKKIKKEERRQRQSGIDSNPGYDLASGDVPDEAKALPSKSMALQGSSERSDVPSSKYRSVSKYNSSEKSKRSKDGDVFLPEDKNKEHSYPSDAQKPDLSSKKRIVKEWEESQHNSTPPVTRSHNHLHSANKNNLLTDGSSIQHRMAVLDTKGDSMVHENKRSVTSLQDRNGSTHYPPDGNPQSEVSFGKEKSHPKSSKHDMQNSKAQMLPSPLKESKVESHSAPLRSNASKLTAQLKRGNVENGGQHGITKQAISNPADTSSPVRKDNNSTGYALKEARDLKHKANRLKEEGKEQESTRLYFESALKYLHVASTLEPPPSIDGFKQCDAAQNLYSDTAKLCNFVGHAYEKSKKMAAAALAYKCVEVAYLKAAYYKYPTASKDRQMLQAIVQNPPGESPSSSASDIDNLNNNGLSKGPSSKDANSPQVTGNNLLLAARNQPHMTRLLAYTNDVNCAFDATRKSQMAIASAASNQENGIDGLSSVKTVLDFNFQSVNDLLRLVRLSMESISC
uniref:CW-type domain-containing protein n=1 Tax=Oryza meridionalis TaxID=40149 RepID=A0A0E0EFY9_9ORYZ